MKRAEEKALLIRAQAGDEDAFAQLYQAHVQAVYRYVYQRVSDVHLAEDITGDVFMKAVAGLPGYQDRGQSWLAWLYRIAHARVIDYYRRRDRRPQESDIEAAVITSDVDPDANLVQQNIQQALRIALEDLTDEQQQVIILRFIEGQRIDVVAAAMGKTPNAIKALQHRAMKAMANRLQRAGFDIQMVLGGLS